MPHLLSDFLNKTPSYILLRRKDGGKTKEIKARLNNLLLFNILGEQL
jgi:hypothetical protein